MECCSLDRGCRAATRSSRPILRSHEASSWGAGSRCYVVVRRAACFVALERQWMLVWSIGRPARGQQRQEPESPTSLFTGQLEPHRRRRSGRDVVRIATASESDTPPPPVNTKGDILANSLRGRDE